MTKKHRYEKTGSGSGRENKRYPKFKRQHKSLGGIPMKIKDGKIVYAQYVPHNYTEGYSKERGTYYEDAESVGRKKAVAPSGDGDFVRRHVYEVRFGIKADGEETDDERRTREYKEWWEKRKV